MIMTIVVKVYYDALCYQMLHFIVAMNVLRFGKNVDIQITMTSRMDLQLTMHYTIPFAYRLQLQ